MGSWIERTIMLAATLAVVGCDQASDDAPATVSDSAGVRVITSSTPAPDLGWRLERIRDLSSPDSALTAVPWGVVADEASQTVFVMDWTGTRVSVFGPDGAWQRDIGRGGEGPGEFSNPSAATINPDGRLLVWDSGRQVLSTWSESGELLAESRQTLDFWGPGFGVVNGNLVTVVNEEAAGPEESLQSLVVLSQYGGSEALLTLDVAQNPVDLPCLPSGFMAPPILAPSIVWTAADGEIAFGVGSGYRVDRWEAGEVRSSVRRSVEPIRVTQAVASRAMEVGPGPYAAFMERCGVSASVVLNAVGHVDEVSPVLWVAIDPLDRLWMTTTTDGIAPTGIDVFDSDGTLLTTFTHDAAVVGFAATDRVVTIRTTELGATVVSIEELIGESTAPGVDKSADTFRDCESCPEMVTIPAGVATIGTPTSDLSGARSADRPAWSVAAEAPRVEIEVPSFDIAAFETTFAEWDACVSAGGCTHTPDDGGWGRGDRPVIHVSRPDAEQYVAWLSEVTGHTYRLPSEVEWEYAARAGTTTDRWWGDELGSGRAVCDGCGSEWDDESTAPVGSLPPNPFGLHDTLGNVSEWVSDCWVPDHSVRPLSPEPAVAESEAFVGGVCRWPVQRGGAWSFYPWTTRVAQRGFYHPGNWTSRDSDAVGFRVVREIPAG